MKPTPDLYYQGMIGGAKYFLCNNRTYRFHMNGLSAPEVRLAHTSLTDRPIWRTLPDGPMARAIRSAAAYTG